MRSRQLRAWPCSRARLSAWPQHGVTAGLALSTVVLLGTRVATVENPRGHHTRPLTEDELLAKFTTLIAEPVQAAEWWERLTTLRAVADCADLFREAR